MRLSDAIRLGSMLKPQAVGYERGRVEWPRSHGDVLGLRSYETSCAFAAAIDAFPLDRVPATDNSVPLRGDVPATMMLQPPDEWQVVLSASPRCPECGLFDAGVRMIAHLNDDHRWTREQIADWVQSIEDAQTPPDPTCGSSVETPEQAPTPAVAHVRSHEITELAPKGVAKR